MPTISDQDVAALTDDAADSAEEALDAEVQEGEIPGEAVYTNSGSVSSLSGARLLKEQTRAKNKETLLEIINNANIAENQKQEAVDEMIALTDLTERETAAEILLETRGYADAVVTITDESAAIRVRYVSSEKSWCPGVSRMLIQKPSYSNCRTEEVTEIPLCFSISIQSETACLAVALPFTEPARLIAPPYSRNFSVKVVFPASG